MILQTLNGKWTIYPKIYDDSEYMKEFALKNEYEVQIPGSVLSALCDTGAIGDKYADPYYRDNEYYLRELFWQDYWFERDFDIDSELMANSCVELVCFGLDTLAEIYVNNQFVAKTNNMHRTWRFDIKKLLFTEKTNHIQIRFCSTLRYIQNYKAEENKIIHCDASGAMSGNQYIRKAHSMFGWDWGAQLPDAGIFREIRLEAYSDAQISDVRYRQIHEKHKVQLNIKTDIQVLNAEEQYRLRLTLTNSDGIQISQLEGEDVTFEIENPQLWWANGLGAQPLYTVEIALMKADKCIQTRTDNIGLRTFTVSRDKDKWGEEFAFTINGVKFFAMGANYIPEDCIYSRITRERQEHLIRSAVRANYNCIRVWGGGYYPSDDFYDLCDRYGLIVWQDLMYACNVYDFTQEFEDNIVAETIDNVKRLRHHACLGLWCGNNEMESAWHHWGSFLEQTPYLRADYIKQFEYVLPKLLHQLDDTTFFWPSSPSSGGCFDNPDDENRGDTHYWDVWHGQKPFSDYQNHFFRFCSEFGFQSFPSYKTVCTYTEQSDRNIFSYVMESHQKNDSANGKMMYYISENFRYPKDFESLLYITQVLQGIAIKSGVEHWRRNRGRCMGAIYWQMNDNWSVASWSSIDYYGRWKALHYMAGEFFAPVAGSLVCVRDDDSSNANGGEHFTEAAAYVANESFEKVRVKVILSLKAFDFTTIMSKTAELEVPEFTSIKAVEADFSNYVQRHPRISVSPEQKRTGVLYDKKDVFVEAEFIYANGRIQKENTTLLPYKHMELPKCHISYDVNDNADKSGYEICLRSDAYAAFVELDFEDADVIFSENYFSITDNTVKKISLRKEDILKGSLENAAEIQKRLRVRSVRDCL